MSMNTPPARSTVTVPEAIGELVAAIRSKREAAIKAMEKNQAEIRRYDAVLVHLQRAVEAGNGQPIPKRKWSRRAPVVQQAEQIAQEATRVEA